MRHAYEDIEYTLSYSDRKTASIYIERDGEVSLYVPKNLSKEQVENLIEKKKVWIYKGLAEWKDLNAARVEREFVSGEGFMYLGKSYRLKLVEEQEEPLLLKDGYFHLLCSERISPDEAFKQFYREKGKQRIAERVELYKDKIYPTIEPKEVRVMELQNRWGSCTDDGALNFHWKCMMSPLTVLDYIVVHEMVHLNHKNHTEAFWNAVDKVLPDYESRKEWLRRNGAGMTL